MKKKLKLSVSEIVKRNPSWVAFAEAYIEQGFKHGGEAYKKAYPKCHSGADVNASRLLRNARFQELFSELIAESLDNDKLTLERKVIDVYLKRAFYNPMDIVHLDGSPAITEEALESSGLYVCVDGIDIKPDKYGDEHIVYRLADRDKALQTLKEYIIKPQAQRIECTGKDGKDLPVAPTQIFVMKKESLESWKKIMFGHPSQDKQTHSPATPLSSSLAGQKEAEKATSSSVTIYKTTRSGVKRGAELSSAGPTPSSKKSSRARKKSTGK